MPRDEEILFYDDESVEDDIEEENTENGDEFDGDDEILWEDRRRSMFLGLPDPFSRYWIQNGRLYSQDLKFKGLRTYYERNSVMLYRVVDTQTLMPIFGKIFNIGTVIVHVKDKTSLKIVLKNIRDPEAFCDWLDSLVAYERRGVKVNEFAG